MLKISFYCFTLLVVNNLALSQSEKEMFNKAAISFIYEDYPEAYKSVNVGLDRYPRSTKLQQLKNEICIKWTCGEEQKPCDSDRDEDGICDEDDQCPDDKGVKDPINNGCPKDSDGDGVWDKYDKCPNKRGQRNHSGCPDTDGDGVYDDVDLCPNEVGSRSNNGCPEIPPEKEELKINLQHIQNSGQVSWDPSLKKASFLKLVLYKQSTNTKLKEYIVTNKSTMNGIKLPGALSNKFIRIELEILIDETRYKLKREAKSMNNQFFPCG